MTLVVDLGVSRYEPLVGFDILRKLVTSAYTTLVREVIGDQVFEIALEIGGTKAKPEYTARSRWLGTLETKPILADLKKLKSSYASFAWRELEEVGAWDVQTLAAVLDGPDPDTLGIMVDKKIFQVIDLDKSAANWRGKTGQVGVAAKLHALAKKHRLVVHSE